MLDLDLARPPVAPRDAATLLMVRDRSGELEVFCVERHAKSGFLGGAVVFPGGKVDDDDRDEAWAPLTTKAPLFEDEDARVAQAFGVAACREAVEEAALLLARAPAPTHGEILDIRAVLAGRKTTFREALASRGIALDLQALHPFARWVTPIGESRRFDTRFFLAVAPAGQVGAHDDHETTASFWSSPAELIRRFDARKVQLAPPTHRSLSLLASLTSTTQAIELTRHTCKEPICPVLVPVETPRESTFALVLPGDPEHDLSTSRVAGDGRFVLRGGRWLPEPSPTQPRVT